MAQMAFAQRNNFAASRQFKIRNEKNPSTGLLKGPRHNGLLTKDTEESIERIKKKLTGKIELSVSSYDTAWMAMVPARHSQKIPCFPQCLDWVMQNQHSNGSWGLDANNPLLVKDSLSCTLASVLALHKWRVGDKLVQKGLNFLGSHSNAWTDNIQPTPVGFDLIFPGMISLANVIGLNLPLDSVLTDQMLRNRDLQVESFRRKGTSLAYVGEGLVESNGWKDMLNHQTSNGSLCNSPATTAAALIHLHDDKSFQYLQSLLKTYGSAVPTISPNESYTRLRIINNIQKMGIHRYFKQEIDDILDGIFRHWQEQSEDLFEDVACKAMTFRLLRMHGYQIPSDALLEFVDEENFMNTTSLQNKDIATVLELYRASKTTLHEDEPILESIDAWTTVSLRNKLEKFEISDDNLRKEVEYTLEYSVHEMDRLVNRRSIELYDPNCIRMLKTSYRCSNIDNSEMHLFAVQDFNNCQDIHRDEVKQLEKWVKDYKLDSPDFDWHWLISSYFQICCLHYAPEQRDVRIVWSLNCATGTILDEILDRDGSREELLNILELFDKWDKDSAVYCTERLETLFAAYYDAFNEIFDMAKIYQGRPVKQELLDEFISYVKSSFIESEWLLNNVTPTFEEYISNGIGTWGVGIYNMNLYFFNKLLSETAYKSEEFKSNVKLAGIVGRTLNDIQGLVREKNQKRLNAVNLLVKHSNGALTKEDAIKKLRKNIENARREGLRMILQDNLVPRELKECLYNYSKLCLYLYATGDEFRRPGVTFDDINAVIYDPISLPTDPSVDKSEGKILVSISK